MNTFFPVKRKTAVKFTKTEIFFGKIDGEVVATSTVQIDFNKIGLKDAWKIYSKRFPYISKNGKFKVTAHAICGDELFSFEKGSKIAETRVQAKAYNVAGRVIEMVCNEIANMHAMAKFYADGCKSCEETSKTHVIELDNE